MAKKAIRPIRIEGNIAYVPLTQGYEAVIDAADVPLVAEFNWCALTSRYRKSGEIRTVYAVRNTREDGKLRMIYLHRVIVGPAADLEADHRDGNGLNNRRLNLRPATQAENGQNGRLRSNNSSGVKGVTWHKSRGKWHARIMANRKYWHLGYFESLDAAASAYAKASRQHHGEFARTS